MGDYCDMRLTINGPREERTRCLRAIGDAADPDRDGLALDFARVIPPPDPEPEDWETVREWRRKHWGVEVQPGPHENNVVDQDADNTVIVLATKTRPPLPVIATVAAAFPQLDFTLVYHHEALIRGGHYHWSDGAAVVEDQSTDADRIVELLDRTAPDIAESVRAEHGLDPRTESETGA